MAAPTFVGAGSGVVITTGSAAVVPDGVTVNTGDLLILQVLQDGNTGTATATPAAGILNLAGTASAITPIITSAQLGVGLAQQHLWVGRRAASGTASINVATPGDDLYCRLYVLRDVAAGSSLTAILENGIVGVVLNEVGATAVIADTGVTTLGADRLAVNFVAVDDDNPLGPFTGMTGGTWAEAVAEFASATGTDGAIQLQTATIASAGTINGGAFTMAAADNWGVVGLALIPPPSGTAWTQPVDDTLSLADSVATQAGKEANIPDTLAVADALAFQAAFARTIPDTVAVADATAVARDIAQAIVDTLSLADATALTRDIAQPVADTVGLADLATAAAGKGATVNDTVALADAVRFDQTLTVPDTVAVADATTVARDIAQGVPDTVSVADATALARAIAQPVADTLGLADLASTAAGKGATVNDTVAVTDAVRFDQAVTVADTVALTDVVAQAEEIHIADTLALSDLVDPVKTTGGVVLNQPLADTVGLADAVRFDRAATVADTVTAVDQLASQAALARTLADTVAPADSVATQAVLSRTIADTVALTDAASPVKTTGAVDWVVPVADTVTVADTTASTSAYVRTVADTVPLADQLTAAAGITWAQPLADTVPLADQIEFAFGRQLELADILEILDTVTVTIPLPAGYIDFPELGWISTPIRGSIDHSDQGEIAAGTAGVLARTGG